MVQEVKNKVPSRLEFDCATFAHAVPRIEFRPAAR